MAARVAKPGDLVVEMTCLRCHEPVLVAAWLVSSWSCGRGRCRGSHGQRGETFVIERVGWVPVEVAA